MKKSKIIAPALAVLTLSTAAAVTGTVAWFTASRIATVSMENITAVNPEAGLNIALANGVNTSTSSTTVTHTGYFRDASVDLATGKVYRAVLKDDGSQPNQYAEVPAATNYRSGTYTVGTGEGATKPVIYASTFTADFSVTAATAYSYALFFDMANSSVAPVDGTTTPDALKGLRVGFVCGSEWFVWAPLTDLTAENALIRVTGEGASSATTAYPAANIATTDLPEPVNDVISSYNTNPNFIADLAANPTAKTVTIYTWIDGTEPTVLNGASDLGKAFTATLQFKMMRTA